MCRKLKSVLCAFLLVFCVAMPCSAAEITDQELTQLETNLNQLEKINNNNQKQLKELNKQVQNLKMQSVKQETLLQTANESLKQYEKESKIEANRLKWQRNFFIATTVYAIYRAVTK